MLTSQINDEEAQMWSAIHSQITVDSLNRNDEIVRSYSCYVASCMGTYINDRMRIWKENESRRRIELRVLITPIKGKQEYITTDFPFIDSSDAIYRFESTNNCYQVSRANIITSIKLALPQFFAYQSVLFELIGKEINFEVYCPLSIRKGTLKSVIIEEKNNNNKLIIHNIEENIEVEFNTFHCSSLKWISAEMIKIDLIPSKCIFDTIPYYYQTVKPLIKDNFLNGISEIIFNYFYIEPFNFPSFSSDLLYRSSVGREEK